MSSTIHSFPSTPPPLRDQSSRPATLSNQPLFQLPTPSTSIFSPFRQTRLRNQTSVARFWVLESLGSAGRRIVESATAGIGTRLTDSGWNLHLYNPPTTHNLAHRTSHTNCRGLSCISYLHTHFLLLPAHQAYLALPRPAKSIIGLFLPCRVDRTLPTFCFGPGIRRSEKFAPSGEFEGRRHIPT